LSNIDTQFKAGNPGKKKGTKNKLPVMTKEFINEILIDNRDEFRDALKELRKKKPSDFCKYYLELVSYDLPKLKSIEIESDILSMMSEQQAKELYLKISKDVFFKLNADKIPDAEKI
jgi:hypothetical protein